MVQYGLEMLSKNPARTGFDAPPSHMYDVAEVAVGDDLTNVAGTERDEVVDGAAGVERGEEAKGAEGVE